MSSQSSKTIRALVIVLIISVIITAVEILSSVTYAQQANLEKVLLADPHLNLDFNYIKKYTPVVEAKYQDMSAEYPGMLEYIYDKGSMRLFVSPNTNRVVMIRIDNSKHNYAFTLKYKSSNRYIITNKNNIISIYYMSKVDKATFNSLLFSSMTSEIINSLLGKPTYKVHLHGIGDTFDIYVENGLTFFNGQYLIPSSVSNIIYDEELFLNGNDSYDEEQLNEYRNSIYRQITYNDYLKHFDSDITTDSFEMWPSDKLHTGGVKSPNGQNIAISDVSGGYWEVYIWIKRKNQVPLQFIPDYFVENLKWLNDKVLYADSVMGDSYFIIDISKNTIKKIVKPAER